jgi:dienelactone hydrolase
MSMAQAAVATMSSMSIVREFSGRRAWANSPPDAVADAEAQAALRQFSIERLMGYGAHHADACELRGRVWAGEGWQAVATDLAERCLAPADIAPASRLTRANRLYRAAALLRMSQMMMVQDGEERRGIVSRAADLYGEAASLTADRHRQIIETPGGPLVGWRHPSRLDRTVGRALIIGGIEALALDGPGQGESRILYGHYLGPSWEGAYAAVFDWLAQQTPSAPLGFIGNSMGGAVAMHVAAREPRIQACVNNGGHPVPGRPRASSTFTQKMTAHVGDVSQTEAEAIWRTVDPVDPHRPLHCSLLVVHGGLDPLITREDSDRLFAWAASRDKQMVVFSDGDHCIYNHADDKHALIGDWMASRLSASYADEHRGMCDVAL